MSNNIASKALAIAKKQEAERLKVVKEDFLNIMRKEFEKRVNTCNPWPVEGTTFFLNRKDFDGFHSSDIKAVSEDVGFKCKYEYPTCHLLIPEWVKGQKRTQAQLMLYWSNIEINRNIKSRKAQARKMSREALDKIKKGDFITQPKHSESYKIEVTVSYSESNQEFKDEATKIFAEKNFKLISIDTESGKLTLEIEEN